MVPRPSGLSLSNAIDGRDPVASASLIDAVFDSGRYLSVGYLNHQGEEVAGRAMTLNEVAVPGWFVALADLPLPVAEAEVVRGWSRLGKVQGNQPPWPGLRRPVADDRWDRGQHCPDRGALGCSACFG